MSSPPESARVVIVGAGIAGAERRPPPRRARAGSEIVVVDQGPLWETGGSTSHAPGLVFQHNASRTMTRLAQWTVEKLDRAADAFHPVGQHRGRDHRGALGRARPPLGAGARLRPRRAAARPRAGRRAAPAARSGDDPRRPARGRRRDRQGRARRARRCAGHDGDRGVRRLRGHRARRRGRPRARRARRRAARSAPSTSSSRAGIWGRRRGDAGAAGSTSRSCRSSTSSPTPRRCPSSPARRARSCTRSCATRTTRCTSARSRDAYAIGNYRHEPRLAEPETRPARARPVHRRRLRHGARARRAALLPALRDVELARAFNGLMSFTPDGFPLLGESAAARGLWLAQAIWVTHSAGCGRALAELMTHGDALLDLHECDPQRFDAHGTSRQLRARCAAPRATARSTTSSTRASSPSRRAACARRRSTSARRDLGAQFFESAGWERPQWYEANRELLTRRRGPARTTSGRRATGRRSSQAEHRACRERVGLFDLTPFTKVEVSGPGRAGLPAAPGGQRRRQAGRARSSTRRCSRRAAGSCAT